MRIIGKFCIQKKKKNCKMYFHYLIHKVVSVSTYYNIIVSKYTVYIMYTYLHNINNIICMTYSILLSLDRLSYVIIETQFL